MNSSLYFFISLVSCVSLCSAVRFHPHNTDADSCEIAKAYPAVGIVQQHVYNEDLSYTVKSTGTLFTLDGLQEFEGRLALVSHHAFNEWKDGSCHFTFTVGDTSVNVLKYFPGPQIKLIHSFWFFWKRSHMFQSDYGIALLDHKIQNIQIPSLDLTSFHQIKGDEIITSIGCGDAGRLDSPYYFNDSVPRGMQTYAKEYQSSKTNDSIIMSHKGQPLRLENWYHWDFHSNIKEPIIRGSSENSDSGGPVFRNGRIMGVIKGSIQDVTKNPSVTQFYINDQDSIKSLKSNSPLGENLMCDTDYNSLGGVIEYLGGSKDWFQSDLPLLLQEAI